MASGHFFWRVLVSRTVPGGKRVPTQFARSGLAGKLDGWTRESHTRYVTLRWEGGGGHVTLALYTVLEAVMRIIHMQVACKSMRTACSTVAVRSEARRLHSDGASSSTPLRPSR